MSLTTRDAYSTGSALESEGIPVPGPGYYDLQNAKAALNPAKVNIIQICFENFFI